ncbi:MAG: DNA-protecting protein DprA [Chloroflexi bacterium]|nr:DNA-protecting protein DprA [Chloroflexota bacterium]
MADTAFWVGFNRIPGVGPARLRRLLDYFGDLERAWYAGSAELAAAGLDAKSIEGFLLGRSKIDLDAEMEKLRRFDARALTWLDPGYPERLKEIEGSPPILYVRGSLAVEDDWAMAVVGTRRATAYGRQAAEKLSADLARNKVTVVSGLAKGIDTVAHTAALDAGGRTIAVLGCGVDIVYPSENLKLARSVIERGALISEYPLGTRPDAANFPPRNRIISGLSLGVVVVEAPESSGAQITVSFALEQGREVFAVPGNIFSSTSRGTNKLIQDGAKLVLTCQDVLEELNLTMVSQQLEMKELIPANETESLLLKCLTAEPMHVDEVRRESGLPIATVSSALVMMELKGMVKQVGGTSYVLARESPADPIRGLGAPGSSTNRANH